MLEDDSVTSFLGRYTQIRDELGAVGEVVEPNSMVRTALNSFTKPWGLLTACSTRGSTPCAMKICIIICKYVADSLVLLGILCLRHKIL
jgi:hypothetical protein